MFGSHKEQFREAWPKIAALPRPGRYAGLHGSCKFDAIFWDVDDGFEFTELCQAKDGAPSADRPRVDKHLAHDRIGVGDQFAVGQSSLRHFQHAFSALHLSGS